MSKTITLDGEEFLLTPVATTTTKVEQPKIKPVQDPNVLHMTVMPKFHEDYYCIISTGEVCLDTWANTTGDKDKFNAHNCYTKENADIVLSIIKAKVELQNIATELNDGRVIDWGDEEQFKFDIYFNHQSNYFLQSNSKECQYSCIYCIEHRFKEVALERMGLEKLTLALGINPL